MNGLVAGLLLAASLPGGVAPPAHAQSASKVHRIGLLDGVDAAPNPEYLDAFRRGLGELGHVEGRSYRIEYRSAEGRPERLGDLAVELVRLDVDVLVTRGTPAAHAAKRATSTTPIVMASSGDPASEGIVASHARPGGNVTGFHVMVPAELGSERLRLLKELVPGLTRVGILWNPSDIQSPLLMRATEKAAAAMGIQLKSLPLPRAWPSRPGKAFDEVFEAAMLGQLDAFIAVEDYLMVAGRAQVVDFAAMSRLPAMYGLREFVDAGGLIAYGADRRDLLRRAAGYVHRILNGARPAELPVQAPTRFELAINLKTARGLGLTIPPALRQRADHLVE